MHMTLTFWEPIKYTTQKKPRFLQTLLIHRVRKVLNVWPSLTNICFVGSRINRWLTSKGEDGWAETQTWTLTQSSMAILLYSIIVYFSINIFLEKQVKTQSNLCAITNSMMYFEWRPPELVPPRCSLMRLHLTNDKTSTVLVSAKPFIIRLHLFDVLFLRPVLKIKMKGKTGKKLHENGIIC